MNMQLACDLRNIFEMMESMFPDKSTEFLLEVSAQEASRQLKQEIDCGDIAEALCFTESQRKGS